MKRLDNLPIRQKLTWTVLFVCGAVLFVAGSAMALYEFFDFRRALAREATVLADVVGTNSNATLAFNDDVAGRAMLAALHSEPHVLGAALYNEKGALFVHYQRPGVHHDFTKTPGPDGARFDDGALHIFRPVVLNERRVGTIYLRIGLAGVRNRLLVFAGINALIAFASFWVAVPLTAWLQRPITGPILGLASTAKTIAERKDYSVRAADGSGGEIGVLTTAFNQMLNGIQERESALNSANEQLRAEIVERKLAESRVTAQASRLAQLNEITRAIGERQDVASIFRAVLRSLEDHMAVDFCCVCLYDPAQSNVTVASVGERSLPMGKQLGLIEQAIVPIDANGLGRCVSGELVYEPEITALRMPFPERLAAGGLQAFVAAPLLVENRVFGILIVARDTPQSFSSPDCEFLRQLSEHVALATHQAQLYAALQRAYDDLRQTQQAVMQQERLRALGQMASGIAHDINNAISPVSLYLESMLESETNLSPRAREWLTIVQRAVEDVADTVARMREFYRKRGPQLSLVPVDHNAVISHVVDLTRARWFDMPQQHGVVIDRCEELAMELPPILGIESEIREALINLVFNAIDAMPRGGGLTLRTRLVAPPAAGAGAGEPRAAIEVADSGTGMSEETQRRCMEPFFTTKGERGTGLGLAMVYGIVQRHGGEVEIESDGIHGTTMRLTFPKAAGAAAFLATPSARPTQRLRLLIVDDDPRLLKSLRETLEGDGHVVTTAGGGQAGITAFEDAAKGAEPFAAVITDLGMPYVDGRKVAAAVKARSPHTPVILLTGWGNRPPPEGEPFPAVDRILSKPPKLRTIREAHVAAIPSGPKQSAVPLTS